MTRARRALRIYVPVRYYHRPRGRDDAHGYGKPSRFLTLEVLPLRRHAPPPTTRSGPAAARASGPPEE